MKKSLLSITLTSLIFIAFAVIAYFALENSLNESSTLLITEDREWDLQLNDNSYAHLSNSEIIALVRTSFHKNMTMTLSTSFSYDASAMDFPTLFYPANHVDLAVYLDDMLLFDSTEKVSNTCTYGFGFYTIALPKQNYENAVLTFEITASDDYHYNSVEPPLVGEYTDILFFQTRKQIAPLAVGTYMIVFGVALIILCLIFYKIFSMLRELLYSGILMTFLGLWCLSSCGISAFFLSPSLVYLLKYASLYCAITIFLPYLNSIHSINRPKLIFGMTTTFLSLTLVAIFLHLNTTFNIDRLFPLYMFYTIFDLILLIYLDVHCIFQKEGSKSVLYTFLSISIFAVFIVLDNVILFQDINFIPSKYFLLQTITAIGAFVFIVVQLLNFLLFTIENEKLESKNHHLNVLAYTDAMTNLANRAFVDAKMSELDANPSEDYCIISLDLNGLKEVNDTYGHDAGDKLLITFAYILNDTFGDLGLTARNGGDEFVVILHDITIEKLDTLLLMLNIRLAHLDANEPLVNHSVAFGYAFHHEFPGESAHTILMAADKRMYKTKNRQKKSNPTPKDR